MALSIVGSFGQRVGNWVLDEAVGQGAFGEVWRAHHHKSPDRVVAVKLVVGETYKQLLKREAELIRKLDHRNIVSIEEAHPFSDPAYLVTQFVPGCSLRTHIPENGLPVMEAARIADEILDALEHAHTNGVVHHDLKPENILLDTTGSVKIVDFGLGRNVAPDSLRSAHFASISYPSSVGIRGTMPYMAPEQLHPEIDIRPDHRCDLYAFGVIWFEMLTGRRPTGREETPRLLRPTLPAACDEVYEAATASLARRSESALSLRIPIGLLITDEPFAGPDDIRPTPAPRTSPAIESLPPPTEIRKFIGHDEPVVSVEFSPNGQLVLTGSRDGDTRLWDMESAEELRRFVDPGLERSTNQFSPDGRYIVTSSSTLRAARLWEVKSGEEVVRFGKHSGLIQIAMFSPDGLHVLTSSSDGTTRVWDAINGRELRRFYGAIGSAACAAFSNSGRYVLSATVLGGVRIWETLSGSELRRYGDDGDISVGFVSNVAFSQTGGFIATLSDKTAVWSVASEDRPKQIFPLESDKDSASTPHSAIFSPDGHRILMCAGDAISLGCVNTGQILERVHASEGGFSSIALSPTGHQYLSGSGTIARLWESCVWSDVSQSNYSGADPSDDDLKIDPTHRRAAPKRPFFIFGTMRAELISEPPPVEADLVGGDSQRGDAGPHPAPVGRELVRLIGHEQAVRAVAFSPDGQHVLSGSDDGSARLWNVSTRKELRRVDPQTGPMVVVAFSPDGRYWITIAQGRFVYIWRMHSQERKTLLEAYAQDCITSAVFSPDGTRIATTSFAGDLRLWDVESALEIGRFEHKPSRSSGPRHLKGLAFSPDGRFLVSTSRDRTARLWEVATGVELERFVGHTEVVGGAAFSPDGRTLATASLDGTVRLWNIASGQVDFCVHASEVLNGHVLFSPDGRLVLTDSAMEAGQLWDVSIGAEVRRFNPDDAWGCSIAISSDGGRIATGLSDGSVRIWDSGIGDGASTHNSA